MSNFKTVLIDGDWDTSLEDNKEVIIYDEGRKVKVKEELYDTFMDKLEADGYDCYLCLEEYAHPEWNGEFHYWKTIREED